MRIFCTKIWRQKFKSQNVTREKLRKALLFVKDAHRMLMKLTPGMVNHKMRNNTNTQTETKV
jgi:hypothetical protein